MSAELPVFASEEEYMAEWVERYKAGIFLRVRLDGKWGAHSLAELDEREPSTAAYWRGRFAERWHLTGSLATRVLSDDEIAAREAKP